jgi:hypothetical protein
MNLKQKADQATELCASIVMVVREEQLDLEVALVGVATALGTARPPAAD